MSLLPGAFAAETGTPQEPPAQETVEISQMPEASAEISGTDFSNDPEQPSEPVETEPVETVPAETEAPQSEVLEIALMSEEAVPLEEAGGEMQTLPDVTDQSSQDVKDLDEALKNQKGEYEDYYKVIYSDYFDLTMTHDTSKKVYDFRMYIPEDSCYSQPSVLLAVPSGTDPYTFMEDSGWKSVADDEKVTIFLLMPNRVKDDEGVAIAWGDWGTYDAETVQEYFDAAVAVIGQRPGIQTVSYCEYIIGYGDAADLVVGYVAANPSTFAGAFAVGATGANAAAVTAAGEEASKEKGVTKGQVPLPFGVVYEEANADAVADIISHFKSANQTVAEAETDGSFTAYAPDPEADFGRADTEAVAGVYTLEGTVDECKKEAFASEVFDIFNRARRYNGYGNFELRAYDDVWAEVAKEGGAYEYYTSLDALGKYTYGGDIDGKEGQYYNREWVIYTPDKAKARMDKGEKVEVLFLFHGSNGYCDEIVQRAGWDTVADEEGFIVVCPTGYVRHKGNFGTFVKHGVNVYQFCTMWSNEAQETIPNDVLLVEDILDWLLEDSGYAGKVDESKIFASGQSFGGQMTHWAAQELSGRFAAAAACSWVNASDADILAKTDDIALMVLMGQSDTTVKGGLSTESAHSMFDNYIARYGLTGSIAGSDERAQSWSDYTFMTADAVCSGTAGSKGTFNTYILSTPKDVPMFTGVEVQGMTHATIPDECRYIWDEMFSKFSRDAGTNGLLYEGEAVDTVNHLAGSSVYGWVTEKGTKNDDGTVSVTIMQVPSFESKTYTTAVPMDDAAHTNELTEITRADALTGGILDRNCFVEIQFNTKGECVDMDVVEYGSPTYMDSAEYGGELSDGRGGAGDMVALGWILDKDEASKTITVGDGNHVTDVFEQTYTLADDCKIYFVNNSTCDGTAKVGTGLSPAYNVNNDWKLVKEGVLADVPVTEKGGADSKAPGEVYYTKDRQTALAIFDSDYTAWDAGTAKVRELYVYSNPLVMHESNLYMPDGMQYDGTSWTPAVSKTEEKNSYTYGGSIDPFEVLKDRLYCVGDTYTNVWLFVDDDGNLSLLDQGNRDASYQYWLNIDELGYDPRQVKNILLTHGHGDHYQALYENARMIERAGNDVDIYLNPWSQGATLSNDLVSYDYSATLNDKPVLYVANHHTKWSQWQDFMGDGISLYPWSSPGHSNDTASFVFKTVAKEAVAGTQIKAGDVIAWVYYGGYGAKSSLSSGAARLSITNGLMYEQSVITPWAEAQSDFVYCLPQHTNQYPTLEIMGACREKDIGFLEGMVEGTDAIVNFCEKRVSVHIYEEMEQKYRAGEDEMGDILEAHDAGFRCASSAKESFDTIEAHGPFKRKEGEYAIRVQGVSVVHGFDAFMNPNEAFRGQKNLYGFDLGDGFVIDKDSYTHDPDGWYVQVVCNVLDDYNGGVDYETNWYKGHYTTGVNDDPLAKPWTSGPVEMGFQQTGWTEVLRTQRFASKAEAEAYARALTNNTYEHENETYGVNGLLFGYADTADHPLTIQDIGGDYYTVKLSKSSEIQLGDSFDDTFRAQSAAAELVKTQGADGKTTAALYVTGAPRFQAVTLTIQGVTAASAAKDCTVTHSGDTYTVALPAHTALDAMERTQVATFTLSDAQAEATSISITQFLANDTSVIDQVLVEHAGTRLAFAAKAAGKNPDGTLKLSMTYADGGEVKTEDVSPTGMTENDIALLGSVKAGAVLELLLDSDENVVSVKKLYSGGIFFDTMKYGAELSPVDGKIGAMLANGWLTEKKDNQITVGDLDLFNETYTLAADVKVYEYNTETGTLTARTLADVPVTEKTEGEFYLTDHRQQVIAVFDRNYTEAEKAKVAELYYITPQPTIDAKYLYPSDHMPVDSFLTENDGKTVAKPQSAVWLTAAEPFAIIPGRLYYVGDNEVAIYLLKTDDGKLVMLDAGWPLSGYQYWLNIEKMGFDPREVDYLLLTHGHADHYGTAVELDTMIKNSGGDPVIYECYEDMHGYDIYGFPQIPGIIKDAAVIDCVDELYQHETWMEFEGFRLKTVLTPGHSIGTCSVIFEVTDPATGEQLNMAYLGGYGVNGNTKYDPDNGKGYLRLAFQYGLRYLQQTVDPDYILPQHTNQYPMLEIEKAAKVKGLSFMEAMNRGAYEWVNFLEKRQAVITYEDYYQQWKADPKDEFGTDITVTDKDLQTIEAVGPYRREAGTYEITLTDGGKIIQGFDRYMNKNEKLKGVVSEAGNDVGDGIFILKDSFTHDPDAWYVQVGAHVKDGYDGSVAGGPIEAVHKDWFEVIRTERLSSKAEAEALLAKLQSGTTYKVTLDQSSEIQLAAELTDTFQKVSSSSGGGSSSGGSSSKTETTKNSDGSTTKTVTNSKTGAVTATTTWPDGTKEVVETQKDGTVTTTRTEKSGVKTETVTDTKGQTTAQITLPKGVDSAKVTIPAAKSGPGTVAVLVKADGTEEVVKTSVAGDKGVTLTVTENAKVKLVDNAKSFTDVPSGHWASGAVAFATAHELFQGTGETTFSPAMPMTRGMLVTVLHRMEGAPTGGTANFDDVAADAWYADAVAWAAGNGIVNGTGSGFEPEADITRETLAVILYRYAKGQAGADKIGSFSDAGAVSEWAKEAMNWAVSQGLITGKDGNRLDPAGTATRAEVATILMRYLQSLAN